MLLPFLFYYLRAHLANFSLLLLSLLEKGSIPEYFAWVLVQEGGACGYRARPVTGWRNARELVHFFFSPTPAIQC